MATAGTAMLLVFWVVTPLINAIFAITSLTQNRTSIARDQARMPNPEDQVQTLSNRFRISAYKHLWADEPLPSHTTKDGAFIPFTIESHDADLPSNATWSTTTNFFSTRLVCQEASKSFRGNSLTYDNGKGCVVSAQDLPSGEDDQLTALYIGYWTSRLVDYYLSGILGCNSTSNQHSFMGLWKEPRDEKKEPTVLFCEPT